MSSRAHRHAHAPQGPSAQVAAPAADQGLLGNAAVLDLLRGGPEAGAGLDQGLGPSLVGGVAGGGGGRRQDPIQAWAEQTLGSRFQQVQPGAQRTAGNQVTPAEFQAIAKMYGDIQQGRSDLRFDTAGMNPEQTDLFRRGALTDIADILQTASGRDLIRSLHDAPRHGLLGLGGDRHTWIGQHGGPSAPDASNALGGGDPGKRGAVQYVPRADHGPNGELRSDVTLYHELVHAHHAVYNTWDHDPVVAERGGSALDVASGVGEHEHQAVGLGEHAQARFSENRYRAERRAIGAQGVGARRGDRDMPHRGDYLGFTH